MSHDITPDGLRAILCETHCTGISNHLVRNEDGHAKLFRKTSELTKELGKLHLTFR